MKNRNSLIEFLRNIPKVDLHCHLLGTIRKDTFLEFNTEMGSPLSEDEISGFYIRGDKPKGILHVLRALDENILKKPEYFRRIAFEFLEDMAAHQVRYQEFFWNPTGTAKVSGIPYPVAVDAIISGIRDAEKQHGIVARLIPGIDRQASPEDAVEMVRWVLAAPREEVIGIGIDYREIDRPPELFWKAYRLAREGGLRITAHAGEFGMPWTNVETAIDVLGAERIDHGYTTLDEPAFAKRCAELGIIFTVVPTNSYYLRTLSPERWALDHPIRKMPAAGLRIHPNADDPTLHHVTPTDVWRMMVEDFDFNLDDLRSFMINGIDGAWIPETLRQQWRTEWTAEFDRLRQRTPGLE